MKLFPQPKKMELLEGVSSKDVLKNRKNINNPAFGQEEYTIRIDATGITVEAAGDKGFYYADLTLNQMLRQQGDQIQHCYIHDLPDFADRGVMMDLGRNHVPTLENLKRIVDILSAVKINHFELYFEGFPFAYASHPKVWKNKDVLTPADIQELDAYCKTKFVDLVPCLNAFGHVDVDVVQCINNLGQKLRSGDLKDGIAHVLRICALLASMKILDKGKDLSLHQLIHLLSREITEH